MRGARRTRTRRATHRSRMGDGRKREDQNLISPRSRQQPSRVVCSTHMPVIWKRSITARCFTRFLTAGVRSEQGLFRSHLAPSPFLPVELNLSRSEPSEQQWPAGKVV